MSGQDGFVKSVAERNESKRMWSCILRHIGYDILFFARALVAVYYVVEEAARGWCQMDDFS